MINKKTGRSAMHLLFTGFTAACGFVLAAFSLTRYEFSNPELLNGNLAETLNIEIEPDVVYTPPKRQQQQQETTASKPKSATDFNIVDDLGKTEEQKGELTDDQPDLELDFENMGDDIPDDDLPFNNTVFRVNVIEQAPYFRECENPADQVAQNQCTYLTIVQFVNRNAVYPEQALRQNKEGVVTVLFIIDEDGKVQDVRPKEPGNPLLDKAAVEAVKKLPDFVPARQQHVRVKVQYQIPVKFSLL